MTIVPHGIQLCPRLRTILFFLPNTLKPLMLSLHVEFVLEICVCSVSLLSVGKTSHFCSRILPSKDTEQGFPESLSGKT
jgi:hypothetical protein